MHNFNIIRKSMNLAGKNLSIETGRMAKQANGAVFLQYGETSILVTATADKEPKEGTDFFPLTVDFIEKMYASGKIPGGFFKREARPSTDATLQARLIDRAIRPLFPDGFRNSVHVVVTVLSYDEKCDTGGLSIFAASAALAISDIPFNGPIAGIKVAMIDDGLVINPDLHDLANSRLDLDVAGSSTSIVMIEAGSEEINEEIMMEAVYKGHEAIKEMITFQEEFIAEAGKEKMQVKLDLVPEEIIARVEKDFGELISTDTKIFGKLERYEAFKNRKEEMLTRYLEEDSEEKFAENKRYYDKAYEDLIKKLVRQAILIDHHRVDGRGLDDIRDITCEIDILPRVHGSSLFTRGETQALCALTLGTGRDEQVVDGLAEEYKKNYFLHYNFPPFSVGEAGFMRGPGRRELGHGALAERAIKPMMPSKDDFPYTIRLVSEILESNGSSSMATVCSATLALMAGGVPLKKPVAGIANGLIIESGNHVILTDIMGLEDHLGDMDFKVTGTRDGITAMQMDIKVEGITKDIMKIALEKAKTARLSIIDQITETIDKPREELSEFAPRLETIMIDPKRIGEVIGSGGKIIKGIIETTGADIEIEDDGRITLASPDKKSIEQARQIIMDIVSDPDPHKIYEGIVSRVENFGAFVKIMSGTKEGLVHISQLHHSHIRNVSDMVKLGDKVKVKFIGAENGKISLTMKNIEGNPTPPVISERPADGYQRSDRTDRRDRNDRQDRYNRDDRSRRPSRDRDFTRNQRDGNRKDND